MQKFRKKPIVIEAAQWHPFLKIKGVCDFDSCKPYYMGPHIHTLEGPLVVSDNDWIIRGIKGEYYPCKPDIFEMTYEPVSE